MWFLFSLLSGLLGAILAILVKLYLKNIDTLFITFLFFVIASIIVLTIGLYTKRITTALITSLTTNDILMILLAGTVNALAFTFYLSAINYGKVCSVVAVDRLGILYVVILSALILKETFTIKSIIGAILMILGTVLISS